MRNWWARVGVGPADHTGRFEYGSWVITPCTTKEEAQDYVRLFHPNVTVREWFQF